MKATLEDYPAEYVVRFMYRDESGRRCSKFEVCPDRDLAEKMFGDRQLWREVMRVDLNSVDEAGNLRQLTTWCKPGEAA